MKKNLVLGFMWAVVGLLPIRAQEDCAIPLMVFVPEQSEAIPFTAQSTLETRMRQMITLGGMEGGSDFAYFSLVANTIESSKEVLSGIRPLVTINVELELFVGNNFTGEKFTSTSIMLKGAGRNEAQAYNAAFQSINSQNKDVQQFLSMAKKKIKQYYDTQATAIVNQARAYAVRQEYEDALCLLASIPTCSARYGEVEKAILDIFQNYVDYDCAVKVQKARTIWAATQNPAGAAQAGAYLAAVNPASSCYGDAIALVDAIRLRVGDDWEFSKELQRDAVMLEKARIEAARAIGVAYGNNQKAMTISEHWMVR